ncbi:MAG: YigZ family protein [Bacteroidales bacterium]|nr:YigZ family protein [Bacteroidales bacterium]
METKDKYLSIAAPAEGVFKDRGSRFTAFACPVETEEEIKLHIASLKKEFHDARHHCYAWRLGVDGEPWRASDDGEPAGTAGRQILSQIDSAGLSDVLVVVVRYFGGVKLGVPGLIAAYRGSTAEALAAAEKIEKTAVKHFRLSFPYDAMPAVMKLLKSMDLKQAAPEFGESCSIDAAVRLGAVETFIDAVSKISGCVCENKSISL